MDSTSIDPRMAELELFDDQKLVEEAAKTVQEGDTLRPRLNFSQDSLKQANADMLWLEESCSSLVKAKDKVQSNLNEANEKIYVLEGKMGVLEKEDYDLQEFSADQLEVGFVIAQEQYTCVYPDLDHDQFNVRKEVRDGQMVMPSDHAVREVVVLAELEVVTENEAPKDRENVPVNWCNHFSSLLIFDDPAWLITYFLGIFEWAVFLAILFAFADTHEAG